MKKDNKNKRFVLLISESNDWYLCPLDKLKETKETFQNLEEEKCFDYVEYINNVDDISFTDPKKVSDE